MSGLRVLYAVTLAYFTVAGIFLAALQRFMVEALGGTETAVGVAVGSFAVSAVLLRPTVGRAIDVRGRRPLLLGSLAVLTISSAGFLFATTPAAVILLRLLQGVAGAGFYTTGAAMVVDLVPPHRRAPGIARFSLVVYGWLDLGPAVAEEVATAFGFNAVSPSTASASLSSSPPCSPSPWSACHSTSGERRSARSPRSWMPGSASAATPSASSSPTPASAQRSSPRRQGARSAWSCWPSSRSRLLERDLDPRPLLLSTRDSFQATGRSAMASMQHPPKTQRPVSTVRLGPAPGPKDPRGRCRVPSSGMAAEAVSCRPVSLQGVIRPGGEVLLGSRQAKGIAP
jgi:hypothetical protein